MARHPGILIQHKALPSRPRGVVRCDVAGIIAPIFKDRWPTDATRGDFVEIVLRRYAELLDHPFLPLFDPVSVESVQAYFANGGEVLHLFGVCLEGSEDLQNGPLSEPHGVLLPLEQRVIAVLIDRVVPEGVASASGTRGGRSGGEGDGGPATEAAMDRPHGCGIDAQGNIYVADSNNHRVRVVGV